MPQKIHLEDVTCHGLRVFDQTKAPHLQMHSMEVPRVERLGHQDHALPIQLEGDVEQIPIHVVRNKTSFFGIVPHRYTGHWCQDINIDQRQPHFLDEVVCLLQLFKGFLGLTDDERSMGVDTVAMKGPDRLLVDLHFECLALDPGQDLLVSTISFQLGLGIRRQFWGTGPRKPRILLYCAKNITVQYRITAHSDSGNRRRHPARHHNPPIHRGV